MKFAIATLLGATSALRTQGMPSGMSTSGTANDGPQRGNNGTTLSPGSVGSLCFSIPHGSPTITCAKTQQLNWITVAKDKCAWVCQQYVLPGTPTSTSTWTQEDYINDFISGLFKKCDKYDQGLITNPELKKCLNTMITQIQGSYEQNGATKEIINQLRQNYEQMGELVYKNASSIDIGSVSLYLTMYGGWDKVQAIMSQGMEPPAKKEAPPAPPPAPKSICGGIFASMDVIPGWQTTRPQSHTAEQCLDRCATKKECIVVLFKGNGECWACTQYHGKCYENNHGDQVYLARKPAALPTPVAPKSICDGGYGSMAGVGNWNYQTPHSADANACLERCAGRSDCKFVRFNYTNNNCYAYKDLSGKCYKNDHDHIYSVDGQQQ